MSADFLERNLDCVPSLGPAFSTDQNLTPEAGFLLSQIDGRTSWRDLLMLLPFDRDTVATLALDLRRRDILVWEGGTAPPPAAPALANAEERETPGDRTPSARTPATGDAGVGDPFGFGVPAPAPTASPTGPSHDIPATPSDAAEAKETATADDLDDDFDEAAEILAVLKDGGVLDRAETDTSAAVDAQAAPPEATTAKPSTPPPGGTGEEDRDDTADDPDVVELLDELIAVEELDDEGNAGDRQGAHQPQPEADSPDRDDTADEPDVAELLDELIAVEELDDEGSAGDRQDAHQPQPEADSPDRDDTADEPDVAELLDELIAVEELDDAGSAGDRQDPHQPQLEADDQERDDSAEEPAVAELLDELTDIEELDDADIADDEQDAHQPRLEADSPDRDDLADEPEVAELLDELTDIEELDDEDTGTSAKDSGGTDDGITAPQENVPADSTTRRTGQRAAQKGPRDTVHVSGAARGGGKPPRGSQSTGTDARIARLERQLLLQRRLLERDDPFQALGVKGGASDDEIRDAWHRLSKRFHPDRYYGVDLPPGLAAELDDVYDRLKTCYETIATREKRRAYMLEQRRNRLARARAAEKPTDGEPAPTPDGVETANPERLAELAQIALAQNQYSAAINSYRMAHQIAPGKGYDRQAKLVALLQRLDGRIEKLLAESEPPLPDDIQAIESTLRKVDTILPAQAAFLRNCLTFLMRWSDDMELSRSLANRLLKLNRMPDTLTLVGEAYLRANLPRSALDYLQEARKKANDDLKPRIRELIKEAKRQLK